MSAIEKSFNNFFMQDLVLTCPPESFEEYCEAAGISKDKIPAYRAVNDSKRNEYKQAEDSIYESAVQMVAPVRKAPTREGAAPEKPANLEKISDIGRKLVEGPRLTVLDGGPGAGKSFSLGQAMIAMNKTVICLGATESAASGLHGDMQEKQVGGEPAVLGGLSVEKFLEMMDKDEKDLTPDERKLKEAFNAKPAPVLMVDEAGLLGHDEMAKLMKVIPEKSSMKMILAGDAQQIPPEKGQPFKMLAESLKGTPAYVNAPYVFRQGNFVEKAITSGIYHGLSAQEGAISQKVASEFMVAAYDVGHPAGKDGDKEFSFKERLKEKYPAEKYPELYEAGKLKKEAAVQRYVAELGDIQFESKEAMFKALEIGPQKTAEGGYADYDRYIAATLMCQSMGVQAYEGRNQLHQAGNTDDTTLLASVAVQMAQEYGDFDATRKVDPSKKYKHGPLAITATKEEAEDLNLAIRVARGLDGQGLKAGEPIIVDGEKRLATADDEKTPPEGFAYAYALDVTTTQGMSQDGKVTLVVTKAGLNNMQGGEILVGASRHKGAFEIQMSEQVNKATFFENSTHQYASARLAEDAFRGGLYEAAVGRGQVDEALAAEKEAAAKQEQAASRKGLALAFMLQRRGKEADTTQKKKAELPPKTACEEKLAKQVRLIQQQRSGNGK